MRMIDLIEKKRNGFANSEDELYFIINGALNGDIPDYQLSAWLMAVCFSGMTKNETVFLTRAMIASGKTLNLSAVGAPTVDKHSTGGIADTVTLIAVPIAAASGAFVAKISGHALGYTGGTIDKLESISGYSPDIDLTRFINIIKRNGMCIVGQSDDIVPADKLIYALRNVTATVESIPLIASSIMSKKIAMGADAIVLDIKVGNGAFMKDIESAKKLAQAMLNIGHAFDKKCAAFITDMNEPLGKAVGNGLELYEAITILGGKFDLNDRLVRLSLSIAAKMLAIVGIFGQKDAEAAVLSALKSGDGLSNFKRMIDDLGGDTAIFDQPEQLIKVKKRVPLSAKQSGYIFSIDALNIGRTVGFLGASRTVLTDEIDHDVGLILNARIGDWVREGDIIATIYVNDESKIEPAIRLLENSIDISDIRPPNRDLIYEVY
ncbi:MAG: thymidine phosphorylase [Clostridia bacterium]